MCIRGRGYFLLKTTVFATTFIMFPSDEKRVDNKLPT